MVTFYGMERDMVIDGYVLSALVDYEFALQHLFPLIGQLDIQRNSQNKSFYSRLEDDLVRGCVMPTISIAMINDIVHRQASQSEVQQLIETKVDECFILDGIQRLSALHRASEREGFDPHRPCHVSFIIAGSRDRLLYRMITLNNGQKPMSARHQIEILADSFFDFDHLSIKLITEKGRNRVRAPEDFKKSDFVKGYVAYLSASVNIDNQKIIEEKMDELIASRIIDSGITTTRIEFTDVVMLVEKFSQSQFLRDWIRNQNNFIGFCVGARTSADHLAAVTIDEVESGIRNFENAFSAINLSKIKVGKVRRELVCYFIQNFAALSMLPEFTLLDKIADQV